MKPNDIFGLMDLAYRARKNGDVFNPLFVGPPGIGKSQIVQQWCREKNLPFIDLRAAYLEAPDLIGLPTIGTKTDANGVVRQITVHNTPEFWPTDGEGVILLEEPNRGTTSVLNTFMQILTDRKIHKMDLPDGWIIVGCINPENEAHDVNTMDAALKDRFEIFEIEYDKGTFVEFMEKKNWDESVRMFIETNTWSYTLPEEVGNVPGAKYLSPRTFSKLNTAIRAGIDPNQEYDVYQSILGKNFGKAFFSFKNNDLPVTYEELVRNKRKSLNKLAMFSDPKNYKNAHISITVKNIVEVNKIDDDLLAEVCLVLPADQGVALVRELEFKRNDKTLLTRVIQGYPAVGKHLADTLRK